MQRRQFVCQVLGWGFAGASISCMTGCGTLLHSERRDQPHSNQVDWTIVALDGLGLILFFVPGVVAFAVDFCTGAIYLPVEPSYPGYGASPEQRAAGLLQLPPPPSAVAGPSNAVSSAPQRHGPWQHVVLKRVVIPREELQQPRIERTVGEHVGRLVSLEDGQSRLSVLPSIERFDEQASRHQSDRNFGLAVRSFFERLKRA